MRGVILPGGRKIILSDTVGFIADLPVQLVAAFRATLEEVLEADLILHVRDAAHEESEAQKEDVLKVLKDLGVEKGDGERPMLEVLNKIDLLEPEIARAMLARNRARSLEAVATSAITGAGTADLLATIDLMLGSREELLRVALSPEDGAGLAWAYRSGRIVERRDGEKEITLLVAGDADTLEKIQARFPGQTRFVDPLQRRRA
jgi:GTP-binding protein HflX